MTTITRFAFISVLALASCNKESEPIQPAPVASFSVAGAASNDVIKVGTYDAIVVTNTSTKADTYTWSLGNDSIKTGADPRIFRYPKAGTYSLTLTVQNADGQKSSTSRTIRVLDRVVKQVAIVFARFENASPPHIFDRPTLQAVVRLGPDKVTYPDPTNRYTSYNAPVVFRSPLVQNVTENQFPLIFPLTERLVLDIPTLTNPLEYRGRNKTGYSGVGYGLELYMQDATGTYLASSSYQSLYLTQAGNITLRDDIPNNKFTVQYSNIKLQGQYE